MSSSNGNRTGYGDTLTERQFQVLSAIIQYKLDHTQYPTLRELGALLGVTVGTVQYHLWSMKRKGVINFEKFRPRSFSIPGLEKCNSCGGSGINKYALKF